MNIFQTLKDKLYQGADTVKTDINQLDVPGKLKMFGDALNQAKEAASSAVRSVPISVGLPTQKPLFSTNVGQIADTILPKPKSKAEGLAMGALKLPGSDTYIMPDVGSLEVKGEEALGKLAQKAPEAFQGFSDLTTKILNRLQGKTEVSKQFISDLTKMPELKQAEKDVIGNILKDEPATVNAKDFANKVKTELLPLKTQGLVTNPYIETNPSKIIGSSRYEHIALPDELRGPIDNYFERIYQSPIKTSAGNTHFSSGYQGVAEDYQKPINNYFAHTRIEDLPPEGSYSKIKLANSGKTIYKNPEVFGKPSAGPGSIRRVIEIQSDLFQKGKLESDIQQAQFAEKGLGMLPKSKRLPGETGSYAKKAQQLQKLEPYRNTWQDRIIREEVKQAAIDGKTKLQFPTGETAMKIEGLGETSNWHLLDDTNRRTTKLTPENIKIGKEISDQTVGGRGLGATDRWIITDVLGDGKFKAVPRNIENYRLDANGDMEIGTGRVKYGDKDFIEQARRRGLEETFDISGKVDTNNPIYKFYEKEVGKYLKNKYNAELITDPQGVKWWQVNVKPEQAKLPVEAFGVGAGGLALANFKRNQTIKMWDENGKPNGPERKITIQYSRPPTIEDMKAKPVRSDASLYHPNNPSETVPGTKGKSVSGKTLDWGDVAINNRNIPKGTKIYIPELNKIFVNNDRMNGGWDQPGYFKIDFAIRSDNPKRKELEKLIREHPKLTFKIVN